MNKTKLILAGIIILGLIPRILSFNWNKWPHGDIEDDRQAAISFLENRTFQVCPPSDRPFLYSLRNGQFLDQHPPLWPFLGALPGFIAGKKFDPFISFKIMSMISGVLLIYLLYILGKRVINEKAGLVLAGLSSFSYILIDYSGNGAFYSSHAVLYLLWILLVIDNGNSAAIQIGLKKVLGLTTISATAWMLNYQAIIMVAASLIYIMFLNSGTMYEKAKYFFLFLILFLFMISPVMVRNYLTFGSPFYSTNMKYVFEKGGIEPIIENGIIKYNLSLADYLLLIKASCISWAPFNLYYVLRKFFVLAPVLFIFFIFALIDYLFSKELIKKMSVVLLILGLHLAISCVWPITKFRYFVPMLPLVFLISCEYIWRLPGKKLRYGVILFSFITILSLSYLTYLSVPSHTYYYDGAITTDPFGKQGELEWLDSLPLGNNPISRD